jgi:hypothetical protein
MKKPIWIRSQPPDCGWVEDNSGAPTRTQIKQLVLKVAALPISTPLPASTPDDTPVIGGLRNGPADQIWTLAKDCMKYGRFKKDGLRIVQSYIDAKGKTLGTFVDCIQCSYKHLIKR